MAVNMGIQLDKSGYFLVELSLPHPSNNVGRGNQTRVLVWLVGYNL